MPKWWSDVPDPIVPMADAQWREAWPYVVTIVVCSLALVVMRAWS